jgi:hypothetical protein
MYCAILISDLGSLQYVKCCFNLIRLHHWHGVGDVSGTEFTSGQIFCSHISFAQNIEVEGVIYRRDGERHLHPCTVQHRKFYYGNVIVHVALQWKAMPFIKPSRYLYTDEIIQHHMMPFIHRQLNQLVVSAVKGLICIAKWRWLSLA